MMLRDPLTGLLIRVLQIRVLPGAPDPIEGDLGAMESGPRIATMVDWVFAPEWLTIEQACQLSGWDRDTMLLIIDEGGVDLDNAGLIERASLREFQETLAEIVHWDD